MNAWFALLGGGVLLYFGAEWFVGGASALALAARVPQLIVGLTVVAYGTSAPEAIVGIEAAHAGHGVVALGNVIGSNIANVGLILGLAALIKPARVDAGLNRRELPVLVASTLLLPWLLWDGTVTRVEAVGLLSIAVGYSGFMIRAARSHGELREARRTALATSAAADVAGAPAPVRRSAPRAAATALGGLLILLLGGSLFVDGAVDLARSLGISDRLVGLTIVAIGTSLPELVTSAIAAYRGHSDIAVGNVLGSNIFNVFLCLGLAALFGEVGRPLRDLWFELASLFLMTALVALFIRRERTITRLEGAVALGLYALFNAVTVGMHAYHQ